MLSSCSCGSVFYFGFAYKESEGKIQQGSSLSLAVKIKGMTSISPQLSWVLWPLG